MAQDRTIKPEFIINSVADLRAAFPQTHGLAAAKCIDHIDKHAADFIARSPFLCIGTQSSDGTADVSPRGDPCGFVKVLDNKTLLIPDRPGNNRLDTQANIIANPSVGLLFMVPGYDDTMRVNGTAQISYDPDLLAMMTINDRLPLTTIVLTVQEVFMHCAKALRRSKLWDPDQRQDRKDMPSLMNIMLDQTAGAPGDPEDIKKLDGRLEESYRKSMY